MRTVALLSFLLAGCAGDRDVTASEATDAANAQLTATIPQVTRLDLLEIKTEDRGNKWRITYGGGTGGVIIDVDKHTGQAVVISIQQ